MSTILAAGKHHRTYTVQLHRHESWELIYCTSGRGEFIFPSYEQIPYSKGEIVVIPPRVPHKNVSEVGFTNIFFTVSDVVFPFRNPIKVHDDADKHILNAFSEAYFYANSDMKKKNLLLSSLGDLMAAYLIAFFNHKPYTPEVEFIRNDIIKNFTDSSYKLEKTLSELPISYDYLRKIFKHEIGVTPLEFLMQTRMNLAYNLLQVKKISGYNISEIAEMCGCSDPLYFSRMFKKRTGLSPSEYAEANFDPSLASSTESRVYEEDDGN